MSNPEEKAWAPGDDIPVAPKPAAKKSAKKAAKKVAPVKAAKKPAAAPPVSSDTPPPAGTASEVTTVQESPVTPDPAPVISDEPPVVGLNRDGNVPGSRPTFQQVQASRRNRKRTRIVPEVRGRRPLQQ